VSCLSLYMCRCGPPSRACAITLPSPFRYHLFPGIFSAVPVFQVEPGSHEGDSDSTVWFGSRVGLWPFAALSSVVNAAPPKPQANDALNDPFYLRI
jgi:hypothetical protein